MREEYLDINSKATETASEAWAMHDKEEEVDEEAGEAAANDSRGGAGLPNKKARTSAALGKGGKGSGAHGSGGAGNGKPRGSGGAANAKKNSVLLLALKGRYTSTKTSFDGLLLMIRDPSQKKVWGWANSEVYLADVEKSIADIRAFLQTDDFANQFIGGVDQKEKGKEEEYEIKCGASHAGLSPLVREMENQVSLIRDQQAVRLKMALKTK